MKRVILAVLLVMPAVAQKSHVTITPVGIWPLCLVGIPMPGCGPELPATYLVSGSGRVTVVLQSGEVVGRTVTSGDVVDFGGIVVRYW